MKARLLLFLLGIFCVTITHAQMRVQQDDNTATFILDDTVDGDDWDANGDPVYLYLFIDASQASNGLASEPLGPWPGAIMNDLGGDFYKITIDLSNFYPDGTTIFEIFYTYNDNMGTQNPSSDGFSAVAAGFVPVTTLSTLDFEVNETTFKVINGQLVVSQNENISVTVYNIIGQLVNSFPNINLDNNNSLDLNLNENGLFLVRIESHKGIQVIKIIN